MTAYDGALRCSALGSGVREALLPVIHPSDSHAANLVALPNGDVLCAWFNGPGEGDPGTNVLVSRLPKGGETWSEPMVVAADPLRSEQNPVLFDDGAGRVWLLHTSSAPHDQKTATVRCRLSDDQGRTWGPSRALFERPGSFLRHAVTKLCDGRWLLPMYYCTPQGDYSAIQMSLDQGQSWQVSEVPASWGRVQMSVVELASGAVLGLLRSRQADRIYSSRSADGGRSWTAPTRTGLPNNNSSIQMTRLSDGQLVLAFNDATIERDQVRWVERDGKLVAKVVRTPLTLAASDDEGMTWAWARNVQVSDAEYARTMAGYSYPTVAQGPDGALHVAYSYLRKTIKHVILPEKWLYADGRLPQPLLGVMSP